MLDTESELSYIYIYIHIHIYIMFICKGTFLCFNVNYSCAVRRILYKKKDL